jgi:translation initiation factor IF-3
VRVIDGITGAQIGVLPTGQALRMAKERGLDLVEISASADPPVCKIVDYGKFKYEQEKKKKEAAKHQKTSKLKELKFRIGIDPHDYLIKIAHAEQFLADGNKVRIQLMFKGRQMAHQELGYELAKRIQQDLITTGSLDQAPKMAGRNINLQITPLPEKQRVRKYANFHHGKFINPEEEDNEHEAHPEDRHHDEVDHGTKSATGSNGASDAAVANGAAIPVAE